MCGTTSITKIVVRPVAGSFPPNHLVRMAVAATTLQETPTELVGAMAAALRTKARHLHPQAGHL